MSFPDWLMKLRDIDRRREELKKRTTFTITLDYDEYKAVTWALMLLRRCFDRDADLEAVDRVWSEIVVQKLEQVWKDTAEGQALQQESKDLVATIKARGMEHDPE